MREGEADSKADEVVATSKMMNLPLKEMLHSEKTHQNKSKQRCMIQSQIIFSIKKAPIQSVDLSLKKSMFDVCDLSLFYTLE